MSMNIITSCDNSLDILPEDSVAKEGFFKSSKDFTLALTGLYSSLRSTNINENNGTYGGNLYWGVCADELYFQNSWHSPWFDVSRGNINPNTDGIGFVWSRGYKTINWANVIIEQLESNGGGLDAEFVKNVKGQAHFVRAITYLRLTSLYGAVPLIDKILTPAESKLPRSSVEEVTNNLIVPDLDIAIENLKQEPFEGNYGMATKQAAVGMKVRALLYIKDYNGVIDAYKQIEGLAEFLPDFKMIFANNNENNKEILFSIKYKSGGNKEGSTFSTPFGPNNTPGLAGVNGSWRSSAILPELIQSFPMIDGLPITESPMYDSNNPWANRGPRFEYTFYIGGYSMINNQLFLKTGVGSWNNNYVDKYPFNINKGFMPEDVKLDWLNEDESDFIILRYTDVLLMYAEAKTELNQIDSSVYEILNKVRARAGLASIPSGLTQSKMRETIRLERKLEFAFEGIRYFDIRRWGIAEEVFNSITSDEEFNFGSKKLFNSGNYLWPIPQSAIDVNKNLLPNNVGY